jgi:hypothetical protein
MASFINGGFGFQTHLTRVTRHGYGVFEDPVVVEYFPAQIVNQGFGFDAPLQQALAQGFARVLSDGVEIITVDVVDDGILASSEVTDLQAGRLAEEDATLITSTDTVLDVLVPYVASDSQIVAITELSTADVSVSVNDENNVVQSESGSIGVQQSVTENQGVALSDLSKRTIPTIDIVQIQATDTGSIALTGDQALSVADQYSVRYAEAVRDRTIGPYSDLRQVAATDVAYLLYMPTVADTGAVASTDLKVTQGLRTDDSLPVDIMADAVQLFRNIELLDINVLAGEDTVDLDVVYRDSVVLFQMLNTQVTNVGFSKVGRGW